MGKKIVILGVGSAQADAIQYCQQKGWEVHGLGFREEGAGLFLVDQFGLIDIVDARAVETYVLQVGADILYSVGSDIAMATIGAVCKNLNLPFFVSAEKAGMIQKKGDLRSFLNQYGISPVKFILGRKISDFKGWDIYPSIIKPVDSQGQRGIYELSGEEDLIRFFPLAQAHSRSGEVIIEKYINGPEISVNTFVKDGSIEDIFVSDRFIIKELPGGIVKGHRVPSMHTEKIQESARRLSEQCIKALEIKNGPVYFQMKVQDDDLFVIEITPRLDGCHLWRLIQYKYGVDLLDKTFSLLAGIPAKKPSQPVQGEFILEFNLQKPATVFSGKTKTNPKAVFYCHYYQDGEKVRTINGHLEKVGYEIRKM